MKRTIIFLYTLLIGISGAWAQSQISKAVAGTYLFDSSNPALTVKKEGASIWTNNDGSIAMGHTDLSTVTSSRTYAAVVMRVDMPTTPPSSFKQFINLKTSNDNTGSIGLGVTNEGKLKGTWGAKAYGPETTSAVTGEHTIVLLCNNDGTTIYVDDASTSVISGGLKCDTKWTVLRIESDYVSRVKSVYVFSGEQASNISAFFTELSNVVTVANGKTKSVSENISGTRFFVASGGTLSVDAAYDLDKIEGAGDVTLGADATISGNKSTVATGKLTINEGKTLTLGTHQNQTNSIESFSSIELSGTIKHNNSVATLNNVTVPADKTGKIFAYDMGSTSDGFKLAGTTTLNGNLTVCNKYNFQMKVDKLAGSGTLLICGTTGDTFDDTKTTSNENAIVKVGSSPSFTGTIHEANTKSNLSIIGTLKNCTLKGTQAPDGYPQLADGAVLDSVILEGDKRIGTTGSVTIKDLAGNNLSGTSNNYAFIGSGTLNFEGTCDLTKKSDNSASTCSNIGYANGNNIVIKSGATVTASKFYNSSGNNAAITVEGTISALSFDGTATLAEGSTTTLSDATPFGAAVTVSGDATLNLTAATSSLNSAITVAEGKTLTIDGGSNTVNLTGTVFGSGNIVLSYFPTAATHPTVTDWTGAVEFSDGGSSSTDLQAIFNAWGNTNSTIKLNNVNGGYLGNNGTVNPTLNILSGKTLTLNNGYSNSNSTITRVTGAGTLVRQGWSGSTNHNLYITALADFTGTLKGTGHSIIVKKLVLDAAPAVNNLLITTSGTVTLNELWLGLQKTEAYTWDTNTVGGVTGIYVASSNPVQLARESAANDVAPYSNFIGTGVGKYTISLGNDKYNSKEDFLAALVAWTTVSDYTVPIVTINQPTSAFYRIKSGSKYLQDVRKSDSETQRTLTDAEGADEAAETIFYLNSNTLVGYKTGYGFGFSVCQTQDTEHLNSMLFTESTETGMGKYTIQSQQGTYADASYNEGYWGVDGNELSRVNDAASGACWTIEKVTSLPVTITAAGWATAYFPVAVTIPENVKAYRGTINNGFVHLDEIDGIIPANCAVVLSGDAGTYNFEVTTTDETAGNNDFKGNVATFVIPSTDTYYTLRADSDGSNPGFFTKEAGKNIQGFRAYLRVDGASQVRALMFHENTGVNIPVELIQSENAYDLQGRRVQTPTRGLYIINGKKVIF